MLIRFGYLIFSFLSYCVLLSPWCAWGNSHLWHLRNLDSCASWHTIWCVFFRCSTHPKNYEHYCNYNPPSAKLKGGILVSPCLSVCLSVYLWTESCPLCIFNNTRPIHFIFCTSYQATSKVLHVKLVSKLKFFGKFFKFVTLTLSSFDLRSDMTQ